MSPSWLHLQCALLTLILASVIQVKAYCWQPGKNPYFTGPPKVEEVDTKTVRVSWSDLVENRHCTDQFLVKYWRKYNPDPRSYELTDWVHPDHNSIDVEVIPGWEYQFQAIAREEKGILGVDYNRSPIVDFRTQPSRS